MRKEELKCTTTHRGTDSPQPWQKRRLGESCGGRRLSRGMCEGPRAGGWRQRNSSLNENIKSKIRISPSSAAGAEDAVGGGLWTGGLVAPAWVHVRPVFSRYSATIRVSTALNSPRCSQLLTWSGHTSPIKVIPPALSLEGIFLFSLQREHRGAYAFTLELQMWILKPFYTQLQILLIFQAGKGHSPFKLPYHSCIQKYVRFLQLTTRP